MRLAIEHLHTTRLLYNYVFILSNKYFFLFSTDGNTYILGTLCISLWINKSNYHTFMTDNFIKNPYYLS